MSCAASCHVIRAELVDESFRVRRLLDDSFLVVLTYWSRQLVIIHCRSILSLTPQLCDSNWIFDFENTYTKQHKVNAVDFCGYCQRQGHIDLHYKLLANCVILMDRAASVNHVGVVRSSFCAWVTRAMCIKNTPMSRLVLRCVVTCQRTAARTARVPYLLGYTCFNSAARPLPTKVEFNELQTQTCIDISLRWMKMALAKQNSHVACMWMRLVIHTCSNDMRSDKRVNRRWRDVSVTLHKLVYIQRQVSFGLPSCSRVLRCRQIQAYFCIFPQHFTNLFP